MNKERKLRRGWFETTICYVYLTILAIIAAFPLVWILLSSVKGRGEITGNPTTFCPKSFTLENFKIVIEQLISITTSLIVSSLRVLPLRLQV